MNDSEILAVNQRLLDSIAAGDWSAYSELCDKSLTAFEPEAEGQLVEGLAFHEFYFKLPKSGSPRHTTMASPHVRVMGDVAVVAYTRLNQYLNVEGHSETQSVNETRVWQ